MVTDILADISAFAAIGPEWDAALSASALNGPYLRHAWLLEWWQAYGHGELAVVTCRDDATGELQGALPLYACPQRMLRRSTALRLLGDVRAGATGIGPFARRGTEDSVIRCLCDALLDRPDRWDSLDLRPFDGSDPCSLRFAEALASSGRVGHMRCTEEHYTRPRISLPATWDEYLSATLSRDHRRSVRRSRKHASAIGATVELVDHGTDLHAAIDDALGLNEARLRGVVSPDYATTPARRSFLHRVLPVLMAENRLRLFFLVIDGERVACECQMNHGDTRYAMWAGYLPSRACDEVSKTLFGHVVESAIDEGCAALDFGLGDQPYKKSWGATCEQRYGRTQVYAASMQGRLSRGRDGGLALAQRGFEAAPKAMRDPLWRLAQGVRAKMGPG